MKLRHILITFLIIAFSTSLFSQSVHEQKFQLGRSYEQSGDLESAERLYGEVARAIPENKVYFEAYVNLLKSQEKYDKLLPFVQSRIDIYQSIEIMNLYAELNWRAGKIDIAEEFWKTNMEKYKSSPEVYETIAQTQVNLRLYPKAAATLLAGRKALDSDNAFSNSLSKVYMSMGDYEKGTDEVLALLRSTQDIALAQGRLYAFMTNDNAIDYIDSKLAKTVSGNDENFLLLELYSWFLNTTGRHDKALDIVIRLDRAKKSSGRDILMFGNNALQAGNYNVAIEAFSELIKRGKQNPYAPSAMYGISRTQEVMLLNKGKMTDSEIKELIGSYMKVIEEYPQSNNAAESYYRIASIYAEIPDKRDEAVEMLDLLSKKFSNSRVNHKGINLRGDILIKQGKLEKAKETYTTLVEGPRSILDEEKRRALFMVGEIDFMRGYPDSALAIYQILTNFLESDAANDALARMYLINQNLQFQKALLIYANAELLKFQDKDDKAIKQYQSAATTAVGTPLAELAIIEIADIHYEQSRYIEARQMYQRVIDEFPQSIYHDYCLLQIGMAFFKEDKLVEAKQYFNEILVKYPKSIYLEEARKKIREIRRDDS